MNLVFVAIALIWLQLFWTLVPTWRFAEYYGYGWFVPLLAAGLAWRRWRMLPEITAESANNSLAPKRWLVWSMILAALLIAPLRLISIADPAWRPPLILHALIVLAITHFLLWQQFGRKLSLSFLLVTVFAMTVVPYPYQFEQLFIHKLTGSVVSLTCEVFLLSGRPVEMLGERLALGNNIVEVSEGCSGIRSFQSLIMVALFFGELLFLSIPRRLLLLLVAGGCALGINTLRALTLAEIHFTKGREMADYYHDLIGNSAFALSAFILFIAARLLLPSLPLGRLVIRQSVANSNSPH